jgi:hypothetical protein
MVSILPDGISGKNTDDNVLPDTAIRVYNLTLKKALTDKLKLGKP